MVMEHILQSLKNTLPGRSSQTEKLFNLFAYEDEPYVESIFVYGGPSTGKSITVKSVLEKLHVTYCIVNLVECYTAKILFETILNKLYCHKLDPDNPIPLSKCDIAMDFINNLQINYSSEQFRNFVIVIDKAEELRNMNFNLLGIFLKLRELCGLPVTVLFISEIAFENYFHQIVNPLKIFFPQYNRNEIFQILLLNEDKVRNVVENHYLQQINFNSEFYQNYLNLFLSVFYRTTRNVSELTYMCRVNFIKYCKPIVDGTYKIEDSLELWRNISAILKNSMESLHVSVEAADSAHVKSQSKDMVAILELPFYAKYLLIAAYLASYNSTKEDKRLFMKFTGRKKLRTQTKVQRNIVKQISVQLGPSSFTFDRLLAIFYSILDQKVGFNNNLLVQVSSLVELKFLSAISDNTSIDTQKYKCNLTYEFIQEIARMMGLNIRKYLYDV